MRPIRTIALLAACALGCRSQRLEAQPDWARGGVCYEIFVRSFQDSDGDGIGDLDGLIQRLDYLNDGRPGGDDLGVTCLWLMPIAESPSYHGYDVADYDHVDREYGTDDDFRRLMAEAHRRGIRVIVDLVLNHTSAQHPWFQEALHDTASPYRGWYRFLPAHPGARNPWGGDNWHRSPLRDEYYYGFFWSGMPDLNYQTAAVREEAKRIATRWLLDLGADGFRLDAVSFLVEEGDSAVQHTAGTRAVLRELGAHVRGTSPAAFTIGEVWDSTATLGRYYPDQLDAYFAFELADSIIAAVRRGESAGILAAARRLDRELPGQRWGNFLRNHDQVRAMTELGGDLGRSRVAATLLLTLPGVPFLYYGEEIGLPGPKDGQPEADMGVRTPMPWSAAPNAGFTTGTPWHAPRAGWRQTNVAAQTAEAGSLLRHYRRLIELRTTQPALSLGEWIPLEASDAGVIAFLRRHAGRDVLVMVNLTDETLVNVTLHSGQIMRPGTHHPRALLGPRPREFRVGTMLDMGRYIPHPLLMPHATSIAEL
jgi:alpha-amylase